MRYFQVLLSLFALTLVSSGDDHTLSQKCITTCTALSVRKLSHAVCEPAKGTSMRPLYKECKENTKLAFAEACMATCSKSDTLTSLLSYAEDLSEDGELMLDYRVRVKTACDPNSKPPPKQPLSTWCKKGYESAWFSTAKTVSELLALEVLSGRTVSETLAAEAAAAKLKADVDALPTRVAARESAKQAMEKGEEARKGAAGQAKKKLRGKASEEELRAVAEAEETARRAGDAHSEAERMAKESEEAMEKMKNAV